MTQLSSPHCSSFNSMTLVYRGVEMAHCTSVCTHVWEHVCVWECNCICVFGVFATVTALGAPCWWRPVSPTSAHCWGEKCRKNHRSPAPSSHLPSSHTTASPRFNLRFPPHCFIKACTSCSPPVLHPFLPVSSQWTYKEKRDWKMASENRCIDTVVILQNITVEMADIKIYFLCLYIIIRYVNDKEYH